MQDEGQSGLQIWGEEILEIPRGKTLKFQIKRTVFSRTTPFQQLDIVDTVAYGRMMLLDGVIMLTESDEFSYHEMITHVPMLSHAKPERVLVVGGGDGGVVREALKHPSVREVHLCELDEDVVEAARKYFPALSSGLSDPRVRIKYEDGAKYIQDNEACFDVIIVDSTDPIGPGAVLFQEPFYRAMKAALKPGGIAVTQSESFFDEAEIMRHLFSFIPLVFKYYGYYWTCVPTYPSGIIGFSFVSDSVNPDSVKPEPQRVPSGLRYYNPETHCAAFAVPEFVRKITGRE